MKPKIFYKPYSSIYVDELQDYVSYYEVVRAIYTKTPINKVDLSGVREITDHLNYAYYVFRDDKSIPLLTRLRYIQQTYTLYALGATYDELCFNNTSRIIDMFESIPLSEVTRVFNPGAYSEFTQLFTEDFCYTVPTWY